MHRFAVALGLVAAMTIGGIARAVVRVRGMIPLNARIQANPSAER